MSDVECRTATAGDVEVVVPLIYESSQRLLDAVLVHEPMRFLRHDFVRGDGIFGCRNQTVAIVGGQVVGTMTMYAGARYTDVSKATLRSAREFYDTFRMIGIGARSLSLRKMFVPPRATGSFLANIAVIASYRRRGVFSAMLEHALAAARNQRLASLEFDVSLANPVARQWCERLGFVVTAERPNHGKSDLDGFLRMTKSI